MVCDKLATKVFLVAVVAAAAVALVAAAPAYGSAANQHTQTLVLDASFSQTVVDKPPTGPSVGDIEHDDGTLSDAFGHLVGSLHVTCTLRRMLAGGDALENCVGTGTTTDGKVRVSGVGRLAGSNPPWKMTGVSGRYAGLRGLVTYSRDIQLGDSPPGVIPSAQFDSVNVFQVRAKHHLSVGVVPRPAVNNPFIARADSLCNAAQNAANNLPGFPFPNFDPFQPDPTVLPQVGQFFNQPQRRQLSPDLLAKLEALGGPPAQPAEWARVLKARRAEIAGETAQTNAALAGNTTAFVQTVKEAGPEYNELVLASAVFGVQACTFG